MLDNFKLNPRRITLSQRKFNSLFIHKNLSFIRKGVKCDKEEVAFTKQIMAQCNNRREKRFSGRNIVSLHINGKDGG